MKSHILKLVALITLLTAGGFACTKDREDDGHELVSVQIKRYDKVDPYIVSFALPGIVEARCYDYPPYHSIGGFPVELNPNDWVINLLMEKGTKRTKLAPVITLAPGCKITPASGTVLDFSKNIEWTLQTPDGKKIKYYLGSVFVIDDTDEDNMVSIKIRCRHTGAVDPNIVSWALPGIFVAPISEQPRYPDYGGIPGLWSPHLWTITLGMAKGTDCTKLAPIITLAPGAKITRICLRASFPGETDVSIYVDYDGIAKIDEYDFTKQIDIDIIAADGSQIRYMCQAHSIDY